jgi:predicted transcriptional regulator
MPRKDHTEEQILQALRQVEGGERAVEICRKFGISEQACVWEQAELFPL